MSAPVRPRQRMAPLHWRRRGAMAWVLWPLSLLFLSLAALRRAAFRAGLLRVTAPQRPLIVVGNIAVGGSGKTPVVLWLVECLRARGERPGIVSRGYGGELSGVAAVPPDGDPRRFGDEPVLLAASAGCPVFVGRDRPAAVAALLAAHPECSVVISDDGLQHYALGRTVEIAVVDEAVLGNRLPLPAGPLREPLSRLAEVDLALLHGEVSPRLRAVLGRTPAFAMRLAPAPLRRLDGGAVEDLAAWRGRRVRAVAGIGRPERFFALLAAHGLAVEPQPFADHHAFVPADLHFAEPLPILMTSKDAVKCRAFAPPDCWELPVVVEIGDGAFDTLEEKLVHGQPPA